MQPTEECQIFNLSCAFVNCRYIGEYEYDEWRKSISVFRGDIEGRLCDALRAIFYYR